MNPTPRQLVLMMSIAGLGLSLGKPAFGRIDAAAPSVEVDAVAPAAVALRSEGRFNPVLLRALDPLPPWRTLVGELGDSERAAIRAAISSLQRDARGGSSTRIGPGSSAAVGQRVADQEYAKADALALVLMEDPRVPAGSPAHPQPPATQQLVTGLRLRDPKGSPTSMQLRPWTSVAGPDPQPEGEPGDAYPDPAPAAPMAPPVSTSPESPDAALTDGGDVAPSHAWLSVAELARYLAGPPLEDPSLLEAKAADVDIDLSLDRPVGSALSVRSAPVADAAPQLPRAAKMDRMAEALHQVLVAEVASFERPTAMADTAPALDINLAIGPVAALDINPVTAESALDIELELTVAQPQLDPNLELDSRIDLALALSHDRARGADLDIDLAGPTERPSSVDLDLDLDPVLPTAAAGAVDPKPISRQIDPQTRRPPSRRSACPESSSPRMAKGCCTVWRPC